MREIVAIITPWSVPMTRMLPLTATGSSSACATQMSESSAGRLGPDRRLREQGIPEWYRRIHQERLPWGEHSTLRFSSR